MTGLHPIAADALRSFRSAAGARGLTFRVTSSFRSVARQRTLYNLWLRGDPRVIAPALPGRSTHNYGLSFDVVSTDQPALVALGRAIGLETIEGDPVHFQVISRADWARLVELPPARIRAFLASVRGG